MSGKRMIHSNIIRSESLNAVSGDAETLWVRLLTVVDDNGNYDGDSLVIFANCVRYKANASEEKVKGWLKELEKADLISFYKHDGTRYVHFNKFHEHQRLRTDIKADKAWPEHPESVEAKVILDSERRIVVDRERVESGPSAERTRNESVTDERQTRAAKEEVKEEDKDKAKEEGEPTELTSGDLKTFKTIFRDETGAKAKIGTKTGQTLTELHSRYGLTAVLEAIPHWVKDEGGKAAIQNDKRKREWACANFLRDAGEIIEAMKSGAFEPEPEAGAAPKFGGSELPPELMR